MKWIFIFGLVGSLLFVSMPPSFSAQKMAPDDCKWKANAIDRKKVKNRAPDPNRYPKFNGGNPISVEKFYKHVCLLDEPARTDVPNNKPIEGLETETITVKGFLLAAKFERGEDHDIHAQIGDSADWDTDQLIVEISAGRGFCEIRKTLCDLMRKDRLIRPRPDRSLTCGTDTCKFAEPPEVIVTGYLFLDAHHIRKTSISEGYCNDNGGRGLAKDGVDNVRGLWELHPVIDFKVAR